MPLKLSVCHGSEVIEKITGIKLLEFSLIDGERFGYEGIKEGSNYTCKACGKVCVLMNLDEEGK